MTFDLIFCGTLDHSIDSVEKLKRGLEKYFGFSEETVNSLLKKAPVVLKKNLNEERAKKYVHALELLGATVELKQNIPAKESTPNLNRPLEQSPKKPLETPEVYSAMTNAIPTAKTPPETNELEFTLDSSHTQVLAAPPAPKSEEASSAVNELDLEIQDLSTTLDDMLGVETPSADNIPAQQELPAADSPVLDISLESEPEDVVVSPSAKEAPRPIEAPSDIALETAAPSDAASAPVLGALETNIEPQTPTQEASEAKGQASSSEETPPPVIQGWVDLESKKLAMLTANEPEVTPKKRKFVPTFRPIVLSATDNTTYKKVAAISGVLLVVLFIGLANPMSLLKVEKQGESKLSPAVIQDLLKKQKQARIAKLAAKSSLPLKKEAPPAAPPIRYVGKQTEDKESGAALEYDFSCTLVGEKVDSLVLTVNNPPPAKLTTAELAQGETPKPWLRQIIVEDFVPNTSEQNSSPSSQVAAEQISNSAPLHLTVKGTARVYIEENRLSQRLLGDIELDLNFSADRNELTAKWTVKSDGASESVEKLTVSKAGPSYNFFQTDSLSAARVAEQVPTEEKPEAASGQNTASAVPAPQ